MMGCALNAINIPAYLQLDPTPGHLELGSVEVVRRARKLLEVDVGDTFIWRECIRRILPRASSVGWGNSILRSRRPLRMRAGSSVSALLVAAITCTHALLACYGGLWTGTAYRQGPACLLCWWLLSPAHMTLCQAMVGENTQVGASLSALLVVAVTCKPVWPEGFVDVIHQAFQHARDQVSTSFGARCVLCHWLHEHMGTSPHLHLEEQQLFSGFSSYGMARSRSKTSQRSSWCERQQDHGKHAWGSLTAMPCMV